MDVSRYTDTTELKFEIEFITPTFLGGADGNAEIRTAPFKNLIRRWWRIANGKLSPDELWKKEAELFGSTEKNPDIVEANKHRKSSEKQPEIFGKSKVFLLILDSTKCKFSSNKKLLFPNSILKHPEVTRPIEVETYLGMGPIFWNKEQKRQEYKFKYIEPNSKLLISLTIPKNEEQNFLKVLSLINLFGNIGSRSRNGWGSLRIINMNFPLTDDISSFDSISFHTVFTNQERKKYPYGISKDEKGILCWKTNNYSSWEECMKDLAEKYLKIRTAFRFKQTEKKKLEPRHLLGYPITHHDVDIWTYEEDKISGKKKKINTRLPSQLLFKIVKTNNNSFYGQVLHLPYCIPLKGFSIQEQQSIWSFVHGALDHNGLQRNPTGGTSK